MKKFKMKGFTLIELITVLVIMAILALIVTPLVMSIIRKARVSADRRSIDAYGRSIELAIAGYLLDNGTFPTDISQLTIEYSGDKVECDTTQINPDSSVYLSGCKVNNREVSNYTYGPDKSPSYQAYSVGDTVTYNNIDFYVIKDSGTKEDTVTLLKAEPLTVDEVNTYGGVGTNDNHVNRYTSQSQGTAYNYNGYGGMVYYSSENCKNYGDVGCTTNYDQSDIKFVIDAWKTAQVPTVSEARLIFKDEYEMLTIVETIETPTSPREANVPIYDWQYNNNYEYWTNTPFNDSSSNIWIVTNNGEFNDTTLNVNYQIVVRPVIVISKSALQN